MIKQNRHIEIVRSTGYGLSSLSQESCDSVFGVLSKHYAKVGITIVNKFSDFKVLIDKKPDLVFLGMKFVLEKPELGLRDSKKLWISDFLDESGISHTGSSHHAQELGVNKPLAKQRVLDYGLKTANFYVAKQNKVPVQDDIPLKFPLFVKPTGRGGGLGIDNNSVVYNPQQLESKVRSIADCLQSDALVEEYLPGREFSVAVLKDEFSPDYLIMPIELTAKPNKRGERLLSQQIKSDNSEQAIKIMNATIKSKVSILAMDAFNILGAKDYGRIDIRMDKTGVPHFLEANLLPNLVEGYGSFPKACEINMNLNYEQMVIRIVRLGMADETNNLVEVAEPLVLAGSIFPAVKVALESA